MTIYSKNRVSVSNHASFFSIVFCVVWLLLLNCSKTDNPSSALPYGIISGFVKDAKDSTGIAQANIVLYNSNTNAPVTRVFSDVNGAFSMQAQPGVYFLEFAAQLYEQLPPKSGAPISFEIIANSTTIRSVYMDKASSIGSAGSISGTVTTPAGVIVAGALIVATQSGDLHTVSGFSGPDGFFILYNVPQGSYQLSGYLSAYQQDTGLVTVSVTANASVQNTAIKMNQNAHGTLTGKITFLASNNSIVDVTLVHPLTREAIPGLSTKNNTGLDYRLAGIPNGTYIAWASYRNDGYVVDPDWVRKSGLPLVTFTAADTLKTLPFSVTDAIGNIRPSNPSDSVYAVPVATTHPTFSWAKYPSAKEYIIEVFTSRGKRIWGGYDSSGAILHAQIGAQKTSEIFNFDGSATDSLHIGEIYRWKIYADNDDATGVQGLISSSEDLLGLFTVVADTTH